MLRKLISNKLEQKISNTFSDNRIVSQHGAKRKNFLTQLNHPDNRIVSQHGTKPELKISNIYPDFVNNIDKDCTKPELKISNIYQDIFIEAGGFFPVLAKHDDISYVFCRINAGHLGPFGKIAVLGSSNGLNWYTQGVIQKEDSDVRNPSVFIFPDGEILVSAYKYNVYPSDDSCSPSELSSSENLELLLFSSKDGGKTWDEKFHAFDNIYEEIGQVSPHGRMLFHKEKLLMPVYSKKGAFLLSSTNQGQSWEVFSRIAKGHVPTVVETPDGNLLAAFRVPYGQKSMIKMSRYINNEWTLPTRITESKQAPGNLLTLSNGQVLLTYSDRNANHQRILAKLSSDNGETWSLPIQISNTFQNCDFGYPSTIELEEGKLLTVFYANQTKDPVFSRTNPDFYKNINATGYFCQYSLKEIQTKTNVADLIFLSPNKITKDNFGPIPNLGQ